VHASATDVATLADRAGRRVPAIVADLMDRQRSEVPEFFVTDDPAFGEAVLRSTHENTELMLEAVRRPSAIPGALPFGARLEATVAAQHGADVETLLRTYRLGQQGLIEHLMDGLGDEGPPSVAALRKATRTVYDYMDAVIPLVAREYGDERARLEAHPEHRRLRRIQAVLAGDDTIALGYPIAGRHVAAVTGDASAERALTRAASALDAPSLVVRAADGRSWGWVATAHIAELRARLGAVLAAPVGLGGPGAFRQAHRQARLAERIARAKGGGIVDLRAVALEALALGDPATAYEVSHAELGALAADDPRTAHLRATIEAWFGARERLADAAKDLGIAPRTVSYRLRRAEVLLGHPIAERRAELETALRLRRLFAAEPPRGL
jgi:PucR C-terminal helix-turn-helix domain